MLALAAVVEPARLERHARSHASSPARAATDERLRPLEDRLRELTATASPGAREERHAEDDRGAPLDSSATDAEGRSTHVVDTSAERADVSLQRAALRDTLLWMAATALLGIVLLNRCLGAQVLAPLGVLQQYAARIGRSESDRLEIHTDRDDELGELARALDAMLRALDTARLNIAENARHVGMSDISKGVVHSIGNVLTSVNVSTHFIARELGAANVGDLRLLIDELRQHTDDLGTYLTEDPNGRFLLPFLDAMTASLEDFQTRCRVELEAVEKGINHVVQLVRSIDRYSVGATINESIDVANVIEAALGIACLAHSGGREVEIVRELRAVERPTLDRHKLTTILIHILTNALDSLMASPLAQKRLEIATYDAGHGRFVIEITDSGLGISPAHLDTIFSSGFTTKVGTAGEGLHTAANLCRELGISIGAISEGPCTGATFKLRVPYVPPDVGRAPSEPPPALPSISGRAPRSTNSPQFDRLQGATAVIQGAVARQGHSRRDDAAR